MLVLMLSSHLRLGPPSGLFPSGFPRMHRASALPPPLATPRPSHPLRLYFVRNVCWTSNKPDQNKNNGDPPITVTLQIIAVYVLYYYTNFLTIILLITYIILYSLFSVNRTQNLVDSPHSKY